VHLGRPAYKQHCSGASDQAAALCHCWMHVGEDTGYRLAGSAGRKALARRDGADPELTTGGGGVANPSNKNWEQGKRDPIGAHACTEREKE